MAAQACGAAWHEPQASLAGSKEGCEPPLAKPTATKAGDENARYLQCMKCLSPFLVRLLSCLFSGSGCWSDCC